MTIPIFFILIFALTNAIGGRWGDIVGEENKGGGRLYFRAIIPGLVAGILAADHSWGHGIIAWFAVTVGSLLWFSPGWSFDEINGQHDPKKYPRVVRVIGLYLFPLGSTASTNRKRGILLKGIRGSFDVLTFALLTPVNPWAIAVWPITFSQGLVYWACGRIVPTQFAVLAAEALYGAVRGSLIFIAIN